MKIVKSFILVFLLFLVFEQAKEASAASVSKTNQFRNDLSVDLNQYIKEAGGTITLQYQDLTTGETFDINDKTAGRAASTIKLPLALAVMELASNGKLDLNEKLVYQQRHYFGGSGVIQYERVGTSYSIRDLVRKAMIHSDNIAFIMLKERVGANQFISYMKSLGAQYTYPNG
ncbi:serine hydrolase [Neobacillus vireti]|uniref:Peptidoglycan-binding domain 1 protein n=1 Tax=Neobacillus vireti LMG 21834 TaxID=1131730 RepID=A0AB94IPJ3_9BACI|nr:serine hydrolase [Neobacillus vireti]ETI68964.1 peptidoglycan-binding domain 1 protein [Neobacillus vireti LMG 21834]KLT15736.1 hypothetical protein AA980_21155 [Neobacillus vireti]